MRISNFSTIVLSTACSLLASLVFFGACAVSSPISTPAPSPGSSFTTGKVGFVEIRATDAPTTGVSKIMVTASNIQIHKADASEESWITVVNKEVIFDLVAIKDAEVFFGTETVPVGTYTQIRLDVTKVVVTLDGKDIIAKLPGDKLKVVTSWEVKEGEKTILTLDFDADKSVVINGKDEVLVKPIVKLEVTQGDRPLKTRKNL